MLVSSDACYHFGISFVPQLKMFAVANVVEMLKVT